MVLNRRAKYRIILYLPINSCIVLGHIISCSSSNTQMDDKYMPIVVLTGVFGAIFAFGPCCVRKGPNKGIIRACIMMSAFSIWIFWVTAYIAQMNPLAGPRLHNTTLAWIQYAFGNTVAKPLSEDDLADLEEEDMDTDSDYYT